MANMEGIKFAELNEWEVSFIENVGIGDIIITGKQVEQVKAVLMLEKKDGFELQAIRNSVVKHLSDKSSKASEAGDWEAFNQYHNNMSGITVVIDNMMYSK